MASFDAQAAPSTPERKRGFFGEDCTAALSENMADALDGDRMAASM